MILDIEEKNALRTYRSTSKVAVALVTTVKGLVHGGVLGSASN